MSVDEKEPEDSSVESGRQHSSGRKVELFYDGNEQELNFHDTIIEGRKLLREGGIEPPDDFVLIELLSPGSRSIGIDEEIDLRSSSKQFRAFLSDRIFTFTVSERGYEWGAPHISEADLRKIAHVAADADLVLEREDQPDEVIVRGSSVDLAERGTEHVRVRKRPDTFEVIVVYNGKKKPMQVSVNELVKDALARAITLFGDLPNPHTLSLFTADKGELPDASTIKQADVTPGEKVLLRPSTVKSG